MSVIDKESSKYYEKDTFGAIHYMQKARLHHTNVENDKKFIVNQRFAIILQAMIMMNNHVI